MSRMTELPILMRMTPSERLAGRFMRAPDHDASADAGTVDAGGGDATIEAGADVIQPGGEVSGGDEPTTLLGKAKPAPGDGKDGEGSKDDAGDDADGDKDGPVVPEAYDLKLTVKGEDGTDTDVAMDATLVEAATPILKELGLTNEQANKVLPLVPQIQAKVLQDQADQFEEMATGWAKEVMADKEIGGKNFKATEHLMGKAMDEFATPEFVKLIEESRFGNNPAFVRVFRAIGSRLSEDETMARGDPAATKLPREVVLYPDDQPRKK